MEKVSYKTNRAEHEDDRSKETSMTGVSAMTLLPAVGQRRGKKGNFQQRKIDQDNIKTIVID